MKKTWLVLLLLILLSAPNVFAIDDCKMPVPVEIWQSVYATYFPEGGGADEIPSPSQMAARHWGYQSTIKEKGYKCMVIPTTLTATTIETGGHTDSFMWWWLSRISAPPATGSPAWPYVSYSRDIFGWTSCTNSSSTSYDAQYDDYGCKESDANYIRCEEHNIKTWTANVGGQGCNRSVQIVGDN